MSFFTNKIWKAVQKVAPIAVGYSLAPFTGGLSAAAGAAIGGGVGSAARGGNIGQILQGAGAGYGAGTVIGAGEAALGASGANLAPGAMGPVTTGMGTASVAGNSLMSVASPVSKVLGIFNTAGSMFGSKENQQALSSQKNGNPETPFSPTKPDEISRPSSLNEMANYSPEQERSALATKGVNTGLGSDEQSYYRNLIQRSLIGDGNKVNVSNPNFLMPIESSYFSQQGKNTSDVMRFLQGLQS